jgi:preprotein translocase subunit YajC
MNLSLISTAYAAAEPSQQGAGGGLSMLVLLGAFVLIFYFLLLRPQAKRAKEHQTLISGLAKGDEVITSGGIVGKINRVDEQFIVLDIGKGVEMTLQKQSVVAIIPKGTLKPNE